MKRARLHKRCKMYGLSVLFMLTLLLGSGVSVNAASSITNQTVKTSITASGTRALKIQWNRISGASGYTIYRRESLRKPFKIYRKVTSGSTTSYLDRSLPVAKTYQYAVRAYRRENGKYVFRNILPFSEQPDQMEHHQQLKRHPAARSILRGRL